MNKQIKIISDNIKCINDFPKKGILFRDTTPILNNPKILKITIKALAKELKGVDFDSIIGIESRGFWFGIPLAYKLNKSFIPARKPNKLPRSTYEAKYALEYGFDKIQVHKEDILPGQKVIIFDDLIATGGTLMAAIDIVKQAKAEVVGILTLIELKDLNGSQQIKKDGYKIISLIKY